jgi:hypothetical protein
MTHVTFMKHFKGALSIKVWEPLLYSLTPWLQSPKVHHRTYKTSPPTPILNQLDRNCIHPAFPKSQCDPFLSSTPRSSDWYHSFGISNQNLVHFPLLSHACHMSRPLYSHRFDLPNNIWEGVKNKKLLIVLLNPFPCYIFPLSSKYCL